MRNTWIETRRTARMRGVLSQAIWLSLSVFLFCHGNAFNIDDLAEYVVAYICDACVRWPDTSKDSAQTHLEVSTQPKVSIGSDTAKSYVQSSKTDVRTRCERNSTSRATQDSLSVRGQNHIGLSMKHRVFAEEEVEIRRVMRRLHRQIEHKSQSCHPLLSRTLSFSALPVFQPPDLVTFQSVFSLLNVLLQVFVFLFFQRFQCCFCCVSCL